MNQFAENYAKKGIVRLKEIFTPGTIDVPKSQNALKELESVHKVITILVLISAEVDQDACSFLYIKNRLDSILNCHLNWVCHR